MANVPEYNKIDMENDSLVVITAKIEALAKALKKRAEDSLEGKEKSYLKEMLSKPLLELCKEAKGVEPVEPMEEEKVEGNPKSVLGKPLAEW